MEDPEFTEKISQSLQISSINGNLYFVQPVKDFLMWMPVSVILSDRDYGDCWLNGLQEFHRGACITSVVGNSQHVGFPLTVEKNISMIPRTPGIARGAAGPSPLYPYLIFNDQHMGTILLNATEP